MSNDPMWHFRFPVGAFVREKRDHNRWGQIVSPANSPGHWVVQYAHGGRIEPASDQIEEFRPTAAQITQVRVSAQRYKDAVEAEKRANPFAGL